jgi:hypothetical protein
VFPNGCIDYSTTNVSICEEMGGVWALPSQSKSECLSPSNYGCWEISSELFVTGVQHRFSPKDQDTCASVSGTIHVGYNACAVLLP